MKYLRCLAVYLMALTAPLFAQEECGALPPSVEGECPYANVKLSHVELEVVRCLHLAWLEASSRPFEEKVPPPVSLCEANLFGAILEGADLRGVNLAGAAIGNAILIDADLRDANLRNADLAGANLDRAKLGGADLRGANFRGAHLPQADLYWAKVSDAVLAKANLRNVYAANADFTGAKLDGATLVGAELSGAWLGGADLSDADMTGANLIDAWFDDETEFYASDAAPSGVRRALIELREKYKELGLREQEREITYILRHKETESQLHLPTLEGILNFTFFELTTEWGRSPGIALVIMLNLIPVFALPYFVALKWPKRDGIWRRWAIERVRQDLGNDEPQLMSAGIWSAIGFSLYFSMLSAFHIGWRDLNVGNWISRIQPREYTLQASGWVRTVSGIQSLISVYLLAIFVLTYFGRPFE